MYRRPSLFLALLVLAGCGTDTADAPAGVEGGSAAIAAYAPALEEAPCEALPPAVVSEVVGVPAEQLEQMDVMGTCTYDWEGGRAALNGLQVFESADEAQRFFEQAYRALTPEEAAQAEAAMQDQLEEQQEEGALTEEQADAAGDLAGTFAGMATETEYASVEGVGDQAVYDGTVRAMETPMIGTVTTAESILHVRDGNLIASVSVDVFDPSGDPAALEAGPPAEVQAQNRELTVALGEALLQRLR